MKGSNKEFQYSVSILDMSDIYSHIISDIAEFPEIIVFDELEDESNIVRYRIDEDCVEDVFYVKKCNNIYENVCEEIVNPKAKVIKAEDFLYHQLDSEMMKTWYSVTLRISEILNINCPQVTFHACFRDGDAGNFGGQGWTVLPDMFSSQFITMVTIIAHELRHEWQHIHHPEWFEHYITGENNNIKEYCLQPAEIDAEAFARKLIGIVWGVDLFNHKELEVKSALRKRRDEIDIIISRKKINILRVLFEEDEQPEDYRKNI